MPTPEFNKLKDDNFLTGATVGILTGTLLGIGWTFWASKENRKNFSLKNKNGLIAQNSIISGDISRDIRARDVSVDARRGAIIHYYDSCRIQHYNVDDKSIDEKEPEPRIATTPFNETISPTLAGSSASNSILSSGNFFRMPVSPNRAVSESISQNKTSIEDSTVPLTQLARLGRNGSDADK